MVELFLLIQLRIAHLIKCDRKINVSLFGWVWSAKGSFIQHARTMFRIRTRIRHTVINWPLSQKLWRHWDWNALDFRIGSKFGLIRCSKGDKYYFKRLGWWLLALCLSFRTSAAVFERHAGSHVWLFLVSGSHFVCITLVECNLICAEIARTKWFLNSRLKVYGPTENAANFVHLDSGLVAKLFQIAVFGPIFRRTDFHNGSPLLEFFF